MPQFGRKAGVLQNPARPRCLIGVDHDAAGKKTDRSLGRAHMLIGDEKSDARLRQKALYYRNHDEVIGAHEFDHASPAST
jgi:hypothetical protein